MGGCMGRGQNLDSFKFLQCSLDLYGDYCPFY